MMASMAQNGKLLLFSNWSGLHEWKAYIIIMLFLSFLTIAFVFGLHLSHLCETSAQENNWLYWILIHQVSLSCTYKYLLSIFVNAWLSIFHIAEHRSIPSHSALCSNEFNINAKEQSVLSSDFRKCKMPLVHEK